jgi:hypothetical protein
MQRPTLLVLPQPSPETDDLFAPLVGRVDLCVLRVASLNAAEMTPSAVDGSPSPARKVGRIVLCASWPRSERKLVAAIPQTVRLSHGGALSGAAERDSGSGVFIATSGAQ